MHGRGRRGAISLAAVAAVLLSASGSAAAATCDLVAARDGSDANPGTAQAPFLTTHKLAAALKPGQTGCLRAGTYDELQNGYVLRARNGVAGGPPITIRSYPGERARMVGIVNFPPESPNMVLSNVTLEGTGHSNTLKIYAADVVIEDNEITNLHRGSSCVMLGNNSGGGQAVRTVIRRNVFRACGSPAAGNKDHGIYASNVTGAQIVENLFVSPSAYAIQLYPNAQKNRVANNVVVAGASVRGGFVFGGNDAHASGDNLVERNVITGAATYGITATWGAAGMGSGNRAVANCVGGNVLGGLGSEGRGYTAEGNVIATPAFADAAAGDYRLRPGNECLAVVDLNAASGLPDDLVPDDGLAAAKPAQQTAAAPSAPESPASPAPASNDQGQPAPGSADREGEPAPASADQEGEPARAPAARRTRARRRCRAGRIRRARDGRCVKAAKARAKRRGSKRRGVVEGPGQEDLFPEDDAGDAGDDGSQSGEDEDEEAALDRAWEEGAGADEGETDDDADADADFDDELAEEADPEPAVTVATPLRRARGGSVALTTRRRGGKRMLVATGRVKGSRHASVRVVLSRADSSRRWRTVLTRVAKLRGNRFRVVLTRDRGGLYRAELAPGRVRSRRGRAGRRGVSGSAPVRRQGTLVAEARRLPAPSPGPLPGGGYLRQGSVAPAATAEVQRRLTVAGFVITPTGRYDAATASAVRRFQRAHGLQVDGIVGRQTRAALAAYGA